MAHLISGRDTNEIKLQDFPLVLKEEARTWYDNLPLVTKGDWDALTQAFVTRFGRGDTPKGVWQLLLQHHQVNLPDFANYESKFQELWARWTRSLVDGEAAPGFLKREQIHSRSSWPAKRQSRNKISTYI